MPDDKGSKVMSPRDKAKPKKVLPITPRDEVKKVSLINEVIRSKVTVTKKTSAIITAVYDC